MDLFEQQRPLLTVSELVYQLRHVTEEQFGWVRVSGEVIDWKIASSGHAYFALKDDQAQLAAVMFKPALGRLDSLPENGLQVECLGRPTVYERRGQLQLIVEWLAPLGAGLAAWRLQQLKKKLQMEGLFDPARKRPLPFFPSCVGVVTSPHGAAVRDIIRILNQRMPSVEVIISPCTVQGEQAPDSIVRALRLLQEHSHCQVIILGRGGGASEDLSAFNEESVVREVAACKVPVVSAVGHEVDVVLCDLVADARAPTPTAAAQMVVPDRKELKQHWQMLIKLAARSLSERLSSGRKRLVALRQRLTDPRLLLAAYRLRLDDNGRALLSLISRTISNKRRHLQWCERRVGENSPVRTVEQKRHDLLELMHRSIMASQRRVGENRNIWQEKCGRLRNLDPRQVLKRGFAQVCDLQKRVIVDSRNTSPGQQILVRLWRGRLQAEVNRSWEEEES